MHSSNKEEIVREMFAAFMAQDRQTAERLLADDFTFTSPYDDRIDKSAYFERCWPNRRHIATQTLRHVVVENGEAFVLYDCTTDDGKRFQNVERFTFAGDCIASVDVYFGATYKDGALATSAK